MCVHVCSLRLAGLSRVGSGCDASGAVHYGAKVVGLGQTVGTSGLIRTHRIHQASIKLHAVMCSAYQLLLVAIACPFATLASKFLIRE